MRGLCVKSCVQTRASGKLSEINTMSLVKRMSDSVLLLIYCTLEHTLEQQHTGLRWFGELPALFF